MDPDEARLIHVPLVVAKVCTRCGRLKPLSEFGRLTGARDGLNYMCKRCGVERTLTWYRANRDSYLRKRRSYRRHGLTETEFEELLESQGGVCAICGRPPRVGLRLAVDHDHACCPGEWSCGECVRGLLCHACNRAVGILADSPSRSRKLASYLRRPPIGFGSAREDL